MIDRITINGLNEKFCFYSEDKRIRLIREISKLTEKQVSIGKEISGKYSVLNGAYRDLEAGHELWSVKNYILEQLPVDEANYREFSDKIKELQKEFC